MLLSTLTASLDKDPYAAEPAGDCELGERTDVLRRDPLPLPRRPEGPAAALAEPPHLPASGLRSEQVSKKPDRQKVIPCGRLRREFHDLSGPGFDRKCFTGG